MDPVPTAAPLTPAGRGAVATVRFDGPAEVLDRCFTAANGRAAAEQQAGRIVFGRWGDAAAGQAEEVVLCRLGETAWEVHGHGGDAAVRRILDDLASHGTAVVDWREQRRTSAGVFAAEWTEAVARATTRRTVDLLLQQDAAWRRLVGAAASASVEELRQMANDALAWEDFGQHLTRPWSVVLVGPPNAGKSSLINALLGYERSVVDHRPGTTRDVVTGETALGGWPVRFADTAGLRETLDEIESAGIDRARRSLAAADLRVIVLDVSAPRADESDRLHDLLPGAIVAANKCDLPSVWTPEDSSSTLRVSAKTGEGIEALAERLVAELVPRVPPAETAVPFTDRHVTLLREARDAAAAGGAGEARGLLDEITH
jgi:tRNA modification GTPase